VSTKLIHGDRFTEMEKLKTDICNMLRVRKAAKFIKKRGIEVDNEGQNVYCTFQLCKNGKPWGKHYELHSVPVRMRQQLFLACDSMWDQDNYEIVSYCGTERIKK
jgi:hypothetical protein